MRGLSGVLAAVVLLASSIFPTRAQESTRPVRILVTFAPGGFPDRLARLIAKHLSDELPQRFYVENRPGAGGLVGSAEVAQSAPDGATLVLSSLVSHVLAPLVNPRAGLHALASFSHIAYVGGPPNVFISASSSNLRSLGDVVNSSRNSPRSYGTAGAGTVGHLAAEFVAQKAAIKLVHVPYNGPMLGDVISGVVDMGSMGLSPAAGNIAGGKLRGFGISTRERLPEYPDIATMREQGFDLVAANWLALSGPAGLPEPVVARLGTSWRSSSSRLAPNVLEKKTTPVTLPPGRLRLATRPSLTGSLPLAKRIGTVVVAALAARAGGVLATIMATGWRIKSATSAGNRSI
jgi:tripartite-type tricarboxylate transporter receptor subunit TctC